MWPGVQGVFVTIWNVLVVSELSYTIQVVFETSPASDEWLSQEWRLMQDAGVAVGWLFIEAPKLPTAPASQQRHPRKAESPLEFCARWRWFPSFFSYSIGCSL